MLMPVVGVLPAAGVRAAVSVGPAVLAGAAVLVGPLVGAVVSVPVSGPLRWISFADVRSQQSGFAAHPNA